MSEGAKNNNAAKGRRYSLSEKRAVIEYVETVNGEKGRGGITAAAKRFGVSPLTVSSWLRVNGSGKRKPSPRPNGEIFQRMAELHAKIVETEAELEQFEREYAQLKADL